MIFSKQLSQSSKSFQQASHPAERGTLDPRFLSSCDLKAWVQPASNLYIASIHLHRIRVSPVGLKSVNPRLPASGFRIVS
jgi:hypothetical protein